MWIASRSGLEIARLGKAFGMVVVALQSRTADGLSGSDATLVDRVFGRGKHRRRRDGCTNIIRPHPALFQIRESLHDYMDG